MEDTEIKGRRKGGKTEEEEEEVNNKGHLCLPRIWR